MTRHGNSRTHTCRRGGEFRASSSPATPAFCWAVSPESPLTRERRPSGIRLAGRQLQAAGVRNYRDLATHSRNYRKRLNAGNPTVDSLFKTRQFGFFRKTTAVSGGFQNASGRSHVARASRTALSLWRTNANSFAQESLNRGKRRQA
jgi:hypothetical protein